MAAASATKAAARGRVGRWLSWAVGLGDSAVSAEDGAAIVRKAGLTDEHDKQSASRNRGMSVAEVASLRQAISSGDVDGEEEDADSASETDSNSSSSSSSSSNSSSSSSSSS